MVLLTTMKYHKSVHTKNTILHTHTRAEQERWDGGGKGEGALQKSYTNY